MVPFGLKQIRKQLDTVVSAPSQSSPSPFESRKATWSRHSSRTWSIEISPRRGFYVKARSRGCLGNRAPKRLGRALDGDFTI